MSEDVKSSGSLQQSFGLMLAYVGPLLALGVPILYMLGRVYKEAYWGKIQLPSSLMNYGIEDYLYFGFVAIVNGLFRLISHLPLGVLGVWAVTIMGLALLVAVLSFLRRFFGSTIRAQALKVKHKVRRWDIKKDGWFVQLTRPFVLLGYWISSAYFYFLTAIFLVGLLVLFAYKAGSSQAQIDIKKLKVSSEVGAYDARAIVHLESEGPEQSGVLLECSSEWCVILRRGQFVAVRQEQVAAIDHCPRAKQLQNGAVICDDEHKVSI